MVKKVKYEQVYNSEILNDNAQFQGVVNLSKTPISFYYLDITKNFGSLKYFIMISKLQKHFPPNL